MAGGYFISQNKVRPGAYINFKSKSRGSAVIGERGTAALALLLPFGPVGTLIPIESGTDIQAALGLNAGDESLLPLRECAKNAGKVLVYRLCGGDYALCQSDTLTIRARYPGSGGNRITVTVTPSGGEKFAVATLFEGERVDLQEVSAAGELKDNAFVTFSGSGALSEKAGLVLSGGSDRAAAAEDYQGFFEALGASSFETFAVLSEDPAVLQAAAAFARRMREEEGRKIQAVLSGYPQADYEGVISVKNGVILEDGTHVDRVTAAAFAAGLTAGAAVNQSNTYAVYEGAADVDARYLSGEIEEALSQGEMLFVPSGGRVRVEKDINTLTSFTADKGEAFSKNRVIRVLDSLAEGIKTIFETGYLGKIGNTADGRALFQSELIAYLNAYAAIGAIDGFDGAEDISVLPGDSGDSVSVTVQIRPADSMEKLYMTVWIG